MEGQKWEELNMDILVNVLRRVGMESLLLDVPFVCKSWYKASRKPQCWEHLIFPKFITPDDIGEEDSPDRGFAERLAMTYQENLSVTASVKLILNRSCGHATIIKLPNYCTEEALEYVANQSGISAFTLLYWKHHHFDFKLQFYRAVLTNLKIFQTSNGVEF